MKTLRTFVYIFLFVLIATRSLQGQTLRTESFWGRDVVAGEVIVRFQPGAPAAPPNVPALSAGVTSTEPVGRNGAVILRSDTRNTADLIQAYSTRPDVAYAEPNYIWHKSNIPNDTRFGEQWALRNTGQTVLGQSGFSNVDIHAVAAWDVTTGSHGVVVGVVDSGIDYTHADLAANLWSAPSGFIVSVSGQTISCAAGMHGFNAITRTCDPMADDDHGTHVSGIIGATGDNGLGVTGVSRVATIMALKFLNSSGIGKTSDVIAAIEFAIQARAAMGVNVRILNNSWGGGNFSQALLDEINFANANEILFVVAAGNDTSNNDLVPDYPSAFNAPNIISVAATDNRDALASFSNFGASTVNIGAPGVGILSTVRANTYALFSGTSMAAPMVSGAAALTLAACSLSTATLKSVLLDTVDQTTALFGKTSTGGRLNVLQAISACTGTGSGTFNVKPAVSSKVVVPSGSATVTINVTAINGFSGAVGLFAAGLPSGVTVSFSPPSIVGSGSSTMTINTGSNVSVGTSSIRIIGNSGTISQVTGLSLVVPAVLSVGQPVTAELTAGDSQSPEIPGSLADFYQFTLTKSTSIKVDMQSAVLDSYLYLFSLSGALLVADNNGGGNVHARVGPIVLGAGTYLVEATSPVPGSTGDYFLGINSPILETITPGSGQAGTQLTLTLKGDAFAAPAIVNGLNTVSNLVVVDSQTITLTLSLTSTSPTGIRNVSVVVSGGASSNAIPFTVTPAFPVLSSMNPILGIPGMTVSVIMSGVGFTPTMIVDAGIGVSVTVVSTTDTSATVTFSIGAGAAIGIHDVTFSNSAGTSNSLPFIVTDQAPVLSVLSPSRGTVGTSVALSLTGANFSAPLTLDAGAGITFGSVNVASPTLATTQITLSTGTALGPRNLTATSPAGISNPLTFIVDPVIAKLTSISPDKAGQGSTLDISIVGTGFNSPMTVDAGSDIVASTVLAPFPDLAISDTVLPNSARVTRKTTTWWLPMLGWCLPPARRQ